MFCVREWTLILASIFIAQVAISAPYGWKPGYLEDASSEKEKVYKRLADVPTPKTDRNLHSKIFTKELTKEFRERHNQKFGSSAAESVTFTPKSQEYSLDEYGRVETIEEQNQQRRDFGEYMGRRLTEFHLDRYAREEPSLRPAYEFKEKVSKIDLEVSKGFRFNGRYSFSGNYFDLRMDNDYFDNKLIVDMSPDPILLGDASYDARLFTGLPLTSSIYAETIYSFVQGDSSLVFRKQMTPILQTSLLLNSGPRRELDVDWEQRFVAGVNISY